MEKPIKKCTHTHPFFACDYHQCECPCNGMGGCHSCNVGFEYEHTCIEKDKTVTLKELKILIKRVIGNDYHNIGMGILDYHEKSAVDAFIATLLHRLLNSQ